MDLKVIPLVKIVQTHPLPDKNKIEKIRESIRRNGNIEFLPPLECFFQKGCYYIRDGTHRSISASLEGYTHMYSEIYETDADLSFLV